MNQALDELPQGFKRFLENIEIAVRDLPPPGLVREMGLTRYQLLGVFIGVPRTRRQPSFEVPFLPERIELYQRNIERVAGDAKGIKRQVQVTLKHEIGHYFGLSEKELRAFEKG